MGKEQLDHKYTLRSIVGVCSEKVDPNVHMRKLYILGLDTSYNTAHILLASV